MQAQKNKIILVGATSLIATHCARLWVSNTAVDLVLIGRNVESMEQIAMDLRVRSPESSVQVIKADFVRADAIQQLVDRIVSAGPIHSVLIAHGSLPDQSTCQSDLNVNNEALTINAISPVLFAEAFANHMQAQDSGTLGIIGSVAGDRGRKSNYVYGAAKGLVARYAEGLQHRLAGTNVKVILIKPGPTDTPMTAAFKEKGVRLASVESVAATIVDGMRKGLPVVYAPAKWALIMLVIRHLPRFVFNKMDI